MSKKGFTLIELLTYVGIFAVAAGLLTGILAIALKVQTRESAANEVTGQLNFVMQTIQRLVRESSLIEMDAGTPTSTLTLRMKDPAKGATAIYLENGAVLMKEKNETTQIESISNLTSNRVVVDQLEFTKFSQYPGHDTVSVSIQLTYNSPSPQSQISRGLRSAIARVSAATFDADVVPGGTYNFSLGQSGSPWQNLFLSGLLNLGTAVSDPSGGQDGSVYYNTASDVFRGYKAGAWTNLGESSLPTGSVMFFNLSSCPSGWSELTSARGRYLVGLPSEGTLAGAQGTALADLENRAVGEHAHTITDPGHAHKRWASDSTGTRGFPYGPGPGWFDLAYETNVWYNYTSWGIDTSTTSITINDAGSVPGTNAPYLQLLICQKN